jgi:hypothetical protein
MNVVVDAEGGAVVRARILGSVSHTVWIVEMDEATEVLVKDRFLQSGIGLLEDFPITSIRVPDVHSGPAFHDDPLCPSFNERLFRLQPLDGDLGSRV